MSAFHIHTLISALIWRSGSGLNEMGLQWDQKRLCCHRIVGLWLFSKCPDWFEPPKNHMAALDFPNAGWQQAAGMQWFTGSSARCRPVWYVYELQVAPERSQRDTAEEPLIGDDITSSLCLEATVAIVCVHGGMCVGGDPDLIVCVCSLKVTASHLKGEENIFGAISVPSRVPLPQFSAEQTFTSLDNLGWDLQSCSSRNSRSEIL